MARVRLAATLVPTGPVGPASRRVRGREPVAKAPTNDLFVVRTHRLVRLAATLVPTGPVGPASRRVRGREPVAKAPTNDLFVVRTHRLVRLAATLVPTGPVGPASRRVRGRKPVAKAPTNDLFVVRGRTRDERPSPATLARRVGQRHTTPRVERARVPLIPRSRNASALVR